MRVRASVKKVNSTGHSRRNFRRHITPVEESEKTLTMKIYVAGIGKHYDTLSIRLPQPADWRGLKDILGIEGVKYNCTQSRHIHVRYELNIVDPIQVAAACMTVIAKYLGTEISELDIAFYNDHSYSTENPAISKKIRAGALKTATPPAIPANRIVSRGTAPAYYLQ